MTHSTVTASVPIHRKAYVCREWLHGMNEEYAGQFEKCVIISVTSVPSRCLSFGILLESGAKFARCPIHMLRWEEPDEGAPIHPLHEIQAWDCFDWDFSVYRIDYLREMGCTYRTPGNGTILPGFYWFTLEHTDNGFSQDPQQHKDYNIICLEDGSGQIAASPNNRILWRDLSFVVPGLPLDYKVVSDETYHCEVGRNPQDTAITQDV